MDLRDRFNPPGNCRFAIPKKGRLYDKVIEMLKGAGIEFRRESRLDVALCIDLPITLVFLPAADIAKYVGEGNVDVGITGIDIVQESMVIVDTIMELGFGKCKLCVQAPVADNIQDVKQLVGKRIVTSFPDVTKQYFTKLEQEVRKEEFEANGGYTTTKTLEATTTSVKFVSGSVEAACGLGLADGIVDLVETGTTMKAAGLEVIAEILQTQAILIANPNAEHKDLVNLIRRRLDGFITATKYVLLVYNIASEFISKAISITPGKRSPTVTNLDDGISKSISALVLRKEVNNIMDQLQEIGATDILVMELSNSRM